jgi:hypothetical protein
MAECAFGFIFGDGEYLNFVKSVAISHHMKTGVLEAGLRKGLAEVALGGAFGICWGGATGFVLIYVSYLICIDGESRTKLCFNLQAENPIWKTITIFSGGVMSLLGLNKIGYPRGGPLGVFLGSLIAVNIWKWREINLTQVL